MSPPLWTWSRVAVLVSGVAGSGLFLTLAFRSVDLAGVKDALTAAQLWPWLPLGVLSYLIGHGVRGLRCRLLFGRDTPLSTATASNIVVVGYACNNILPARLGEFVRAGMLAERTGLPYAHALTVTFVERLLDGIAILVLLLGGAWVVGLAGWIQDLVNVCVIVFAVATAGLLLAIFASNSLLALAGAIGARIPAVSAPLIGLVAKVTQAASLLADPRRAVQIGALSLLVWLFEAGLFSSLLNAFGVDARFATSLLTMGVTNLGILAPSTPGFIGTFHLFCSEALQSQGIAAETSVAAAVLIHIGFYVPVTVWGAGSLIWYGTQLGNTLAAARRARHPQSLEFREGIPMHSLGVGEPPAPPRPADPIYEALTRGLLGIRPGPVDEDARAYATNFLEHQLASLSSYLRLQLRLGLLSFRVCVALRYWRPFSRLPVETQSTVVQWWAYGPFPLGRQLFRPIRSLVLLAYFDAPRAASVQLGTGPS
ncbi:MAG: flippase-like domain-containing protein [Polyangiaceae bacterium]|nr:flippase-like domain-containing protein [Polyangiaceae bacterium]